jgi:transketolase
MVELYYNVMDITPENFHSNERDYFILSKGHSAPALYEILYRKGFFGKVMLDKYGENGSVLAEHPNRGIPGIDVSTGSLGHGLSIAAGIAYSLRMSKLKGKVYVLMSDGECQEGSTLEAATFAGRMNLDNLVAIVDNNGLQGYDATSDIQPIDSVITKFLSSGWSYRTLNGHDFDQMEREFHSVPFDAGKPSLVVANTVKGKGIREMENRLEWHYKSPSDTELLGFIKQLEELL